MLKIEDDTCILNVFYNGNSHLTIEITDKFSWDENGDHVYIEMILNKKEESKLLNYLLKRKGLTAIPV